MRVTDAIRIYMSNRQDLAVSATAAQTDVLPAGVYDLMSDVDVYIKVNPTANDVTVAAGTNGGYQLKANSGVPFDVRSGDKIGAVTASGTGTLQIHRVG